ncbi:MAG: hypothetical protein LWY06_02730 [Firmicutes bacterium]|nr:hypothetical protein [Bacillota bacterium]
MIDRVGSSQNSTSQIRETSGAGSIKQTTRQQESAAGAQAQPPQATDGVALSDEVKKGEHLQDDQNKVNVAGLIGQDNAAKKVGSGQDAVDLARKYENQRSAKIKGKMPNFTAAGGKDNNCADFVSSALKTVGRLDDHQTTVKGLEKSLKAHGYSQVSAEDAQPGDVWIGKGRKHTELVSEKGGAKTIGSNNNGHSYQTITERDKDVTAGVYYHLNQQ